MHPQSTAFTTGRSLLVALSLISIFSGGQWLSMAAAQEGSTSALVAWRTLTMLEEQLRTAPDRAEKAKLARSILDAGKPLVSGPMAVSEAKTVAGALAASKPLPPEQAKYRGFWMLRAIAAVEINDEEAGLVATQVLRTLGVLDASNETAVNVSAALNTRGWLRIALVNTLGMGFVPVPGTKVFFSIWETRVQDYQAFVNATGRKWEKPNFEQGPTHPAVNVSWDDAKAFCAWLTKKELETGTLSDDLEYRLPTDAEWSWAVGIGEKEDADESPAAKDRKLNGYPWGSEWPPPKGAGNYDPFLKVDAYEHTSPVGSFAANSYGLYDMGGNVSEWCEDEPSLGRGTRVWRGASCYDDFPGFLASSARENFTPEFRPHRCGFRVVVARSVSTR